MVIKKRCEIYSYTIDTYIYKKVYTRMYAYKYKTCNKYRIVKANQNRYMQLISNLKMHILI